MKVFISYSRRDDAAIRSLVEDLKRARVQVWMDEELGGGDAWWTEILEQIRGCSVFVFALSDNSLYSKPCRAELGYAKALGLPILPVQIGEVASYHADPIFTVQLVDYRNPTKDSAFDLVSALHTRAGQHTELPDPLPEPPPIPYEYLHRLGASIHDTTAVLAPPVQGQMLFELRNALSEEDDEIVLDDIRNLLRALRRRTDVTYPIGNEIDILLRREPETAAAATISADRADTPQQQAPTRPGGRAPAVAGPPVQGAPDLRTTQAGTAQPSAPPMSEAPRRRVPRDRRTILVILAAVVAAAALVAGLVYLVAAPTPDNAKQHASQPSKPSQVELPLSGLRLTEGVAVDSAGTVYVTAINQGEILKLPVGGTSTTVPLSLNSPSSVAVDGAGNLYVVGESGGRLVKVAAGSNYQSELPFTGRVAGVAVDAAGNVYIHDDRGVVKLAAGTWSPTVLPINGSDFAVDGAGNVYVADVGRVLKLAAGTTTPAVLPFAGLDAPGGIAVDSAGNIYVIDNNTLVRKLPAGSAAPTALPPTIPADFVCSSITALAVDTGGNVYVADYSCASETGRVVKVPVG